MLEVGKRKNKVNASFDNKRKRKVLSVKVPSAASQLQGSETLEWPIQSRPTSQRSTCLHASSRLKMDGIILATLVILLGLPAILYLGANYVNDYWKRKKQPHIPGELFWGNMRKIMQLKENVAYEFASFYSDEKTKNNPYVGINCLHKPMIIIKDPELIKRILIKDFNLFSDRYSSASIHTDALSYYNLFFLKNPLWKELRSRLTPVFTSGKMKQLFYLVDDIGAHLSNYIKSLTPDEKTNSCNLDIKDLCAKYTTDTIACCAFGIQANSISDPNSEFRTQGKEVFNFTWFRGFEFMSFFFLPEIIRLFNFKIFKAELANLLRSSIRFAMEDREKTGVVKNDLVDALVNLKNEDKDKISDKLNIVFKGDMIYAQAALFFTAGFETSSATMSFTLYELTKQPEIQKRLRQDIKEVLEKNNGKFTYEAITNMEYLEMIVKETLRMYPPLPFLDRVCSLPKGQKGYSLEPYGDFEIPDGMAVMLPFYSLQRDPKYFPNPDVFDPERFSPENVESINPYTYMPFGRGPRNCIGDRFGLMQTKMGLIHILKDFYARPASNTTKQIQLQRTAVLLAAEGGIFLDLVRDPLI